MKYNLSIHQEDYGFITEAIKLRTRAILESFENQVADQSQPTGPCSALSSAVVKAEGAPFTFVGETKKKPHWTQTPAGKKKMAARKRKGTK
jgi:hypothetical protein